MNRREWLTRAALGSTVLGSSAAILSACSSFGSNDPKPIGVGSGHLSTPYSKPIGTTTTGESALHLDPSRDGLRYVPTGYNASVPAPLVLMLHGATGTPTGAMAPFRSLADDAGMILLAPSSRDFSWDVRFGAFGADVKFIDVALAQTFALCNIDPNRIFIAGFSDGASYSLSLGLSNGVLFKKVVAFSPGFAAIGDAQGKPPIFISHGRQDPVLPIDTTSRVMVPDLRRRGYTVTYQEFDGVHQVPSDIAIQAKDFLLN